MVADDNIQDDSNSAKRIEYHHIKGNFFRVVHVDGGIGGLTGRGFCYIALYNERMAIPKLRVQDILSDTELSDERTEEILGEPNIGVVREVEVDLMMDEKTVRQLADWFARRVEEFDQLHAKQDSAGGKSE